MIMHVNNMESKNLIVYSVSLTSSSIETLDRCVTFRHPNPSHPRDRYIMTENG